MKPNDDTGLSPVVLHAVGAALLLAIAAGGYFLVVDPVLSGRLQKSSLQESLKVKGVQLGELQATRNALADELERGQQRIDDTGITLVGLSGRNTRMGELTQLAGECGLRLDSLQPGEPTRGEMFTITPIKMRGVGSYGDAARFLHLVVERLSDVSARSFRLEAEGAGADRFATFEFDLAWYADPADPADPVGD